MIDYNKKIRLFVEEESKKSTNYFTELGYTHHIVPVVSYAKQLAKITGADEEIVEISAWLHDIASFTGEYEEHHVRGAEIAERLLKELGYPADKTEQVKHCIIAHRSSKKIPRKTIEAECVASADAMAHIGDVPSLFYLAFVIHKMGLDKANAFVKGKLEADWGKLMPEAKKIIKSKYDAAMLLIK